MFNLASLQPLFLYINVCLWAHFDKKLRAALPDIVRANEDAVKRHLSALEWSRIYDLAKAADMPLDDKSVMERLRKGMVDNESIIEESHVEFEGLSAADVSFVARPVR